VIADALALIGFAVLMVAVATWVLWWLYGRNVESDGRDDEGDNE
jgi:hypothetical protein